MNRKIAEKWKMKKKKEQQSENVTAINFKTHSLSESEAEIIFPQHENYDAFNKPGQILSIECGKEKIIVQVPRFKHNPHLYNHQDAKEISVLKSIIDLEKMQCGQNGALKGDFKVLTAAKIADYSLDIVEFLIKETYFSRRDHYKVVKALRQSLTHVFLKKTLYFDQIAIQVHGMMKSNQIYVKSGIIDKNTKLIFRTSCSKLTVGIQLSVETFQLNEKKELYLQKMIEFLYVYLQRSNFFNATHRLTLVFYGRCFYPQFKTLREAYQSMLKQNTSLEEGQQFQKNFAVALQKDENGRIFQDVYRRIIWFSDMIDNFRQFVWTKISEFLFTLNWDFSPDSNNLANFITKSLQNKMLSRNKECSFEEVEEESDLKIRPFVHKLKSQLSSSRDCNLFEAISLITEQYRHHYKFRSLTQSGNTIIILSAGSSEYEVDQTSYKMAKSYVYLTNVYVSLINFRTKTEGPIRANIVCLNEKPVFKGHQASKLQHLSLNCIQKQFYISPTNEDMDMIIYNNFCNKNCIYPEELVRASPERQKQLRQLHHCNKQIHYELMQKNEDIKKIVKEYKEKLVSFIHAYCMDDRYLHIHKQLYQKLIINQSNLPAYSRSKKKRTELDIFQANLDKILVTKKEWGIEFGDNETNKKLQNYRDYLQNNKNKDKKDKINFLQRMVKVLYKTANYVETNSENKFQTSSVTDPKMNQLQKKKRKDSFRSDIIQGSDHFEEKGKVNIFEETFKNKNHQYNAGQKEENKQKKYSSHNKERMKNIYPESNVHYVMPSYNDHTLRQLKAFVKKEYIQDFKDQEENIVFLFEAEKMWKNLTFPLLTPIYTKYKESFKDRQENLGTGVTQQTNDKRISILEDEICKMLMKNYQIEETPIGESTNKLITKLSKGQISCALKMNGANLTRYYTVDPIKQENIIPSMLYRYLSYDDKDCRFCSKYIYFKDKNYFSSTTQAEQQTKVVKIVLSKDEDYHITLSDSRHTFTAPTHQQKKQKDNVSSSFSTANLTQAMRRDPFQEFIKMFSEKYKELALDITMIQPHTKPKKKKFTLNFSKNENRALYNHEEIEILIDTEYYPGTLFQILISWNLCSSVIINEFVENVMTIGRRSKLRPSVLSSGNIFHTIWSITTIGEIIFQHSISLGLLQHSISKADEWLWDQEDYYFHVSGIAFIKFNKQKKLILWRDNNHEKRSRDIKKDDSNKQYIKFFMKAAIFDFLGAIIENVCLSSLPPKNIETALISET